MRILKLLLLLASLISLDQFMKVYFIHQAEKQPLEIFYNSGISLSLLSALPWRSILPFVLFLLIGIMLKKHSYGMVLIVAGGFSNLIDRFFRGGVVDFIDLKIVPVFNMADLLISLGSVILLVEVMKQKLKEDEYG